MRTVTGLGGEAATHFVSHTWTVAGGAATYMCWPFAPGGKTLDITLGYSLPGASSPENATRVTAWDAVTQQYVSAFYCVYPGHPTLDKHWLRYTYAEADFTLPTNRGFYLTLPAGSDVTFTARGRKVTKDRTVTLLPGYNLIGSAFAVDLPIADANLPAHGTDSSATADRVLWWNTSTGLFETAWYCDKPEWGHPYDGHWLTVGLELSPIVLHAGEGFMYQNRTVTKDWTNLAPA